MDDIRTTIKWIVIARLKDAGLDNTPINRSQILHDLHKQASESIVMLWPYRRALDREMDWNDYAIEQL